MLLAQLTPHVVSSPGKLWFLTLVAKQDLWWPERTTVEDHYRNGDHGAEIDKMTGQKGHQMFRHEFALTSLVISNFETGTGERLRPNTEGYDHREHVRSLRRLFEIIEALKRWEEGT
jgi:hypothetical protein